MNTRSKRLISLAVATALGTPLAAHATNGMNLESYGPIAGGMGGASMAYDNGTAAVMNNPATIGMMDEGNRLDLAIGNLRPDVTVEAAPADWSSSANSFLMPAVGWARKSGDLAYGVGIFAQGGMGTEYDNSGAFGASPGGAMSAPEAQNNIDFLDGFVGVAGGFAAHVSVDQANGGTATNADNAATIAGTAATLVERSEVSVGRLVVPLVKDVNPNLKIGGSIDFVWAGLDLQMAMAGSMMQDMMPGGSQAAGTITGGLIDGIGAMFFDGNVHNFDGTVAPPTMNDFGLSGLNYGYFDFSNSSPYTGEAMGTGFAGKLGFTYQVNSKLSIGGTYHSKTNMSDLEASGANVSMSTFLTTVDTSSGTAITMPADVVMSGTIKVKNFQWPATMALGMSYQASDKLMIAADVKRINWKDVMKDFTMEFTADSISMAGQDVTAMFASKDMTATLYQNWDNQTVIQLGAAYAVSDATTVRAGINRSTQPIPESTLHYLFPAITENHYTLGVGYAVSDHQGVDFALSYVPEKSIDSPAGFTAKMSQLNWQFMYSHNF